MQSIENRVLSRIYGRGRGGVVTPSDFLDLGSRAAVDQALSRLVRKGVIRRVGRGLYEYPKVSRGLGTLSPSLDAVAHAVARKQGVKLVPSGARAANALGLSNQVPAQAVYITNGVGKRIKIGNRSITLRHMQPKKLIGEGTAAMVVQALRHLGKDAVTKSTISTLSRNLTDDDKRALLKTIPLTPAWMHPIIRKVFKNE